MCLKCPSSGGTIPVSHNSSPHQLPPTACTLASPPLAQAEGWRLSKHCTAQFPGSHKSPRHSACTAHRQSAVSPSQRKWHNERIRSKLAHGLTTSHQPVSHFDIFAEFISRKRRRRKLHRFNSAQTKHLKHTSLRDKYSN